MSEAGEAAAAVAAVAAPAESLKRELEEPEAGETAAKRPAKAEGEEAPAADADATEKKTEPAAETATTTEMPVVEAAPVLAVALPDICVRLLMTNKMVGMVIGKGGEKIRRVRETSGCQITFSDNHPGVQDRVLMVTGQYEHVKAAMSVIVTQLEQDVIIANQTAPTPGSVGNQLTLKLLVPQSQIGAVIGKGGAQLERMRAATGAQIIAAAEVLPNSTDRPTSLSGPATAIIASIEACMEIFQNTPLGTQQIQYRPPAAAHYAGYGPQQGYASPHTGHRMGGHQGYQAPQSYAPQGAPQYGAPPPQHHQAPPTMQQFTIANDLVGCVIGRGGSEINSMRKQSGAQIRIHHPENGQTERLVSVSGTQEQVAMAHFLLTNKLQQEVSNNWNAGGGSGGPAPPQQQAPPQQPYY